MHREELAVCQTNTFPATYKKSRSHLSLNFTVSRKYNSWQVIMFTICSHRSCCETKNNYFLCGKKIAFTSFCDFNSKSKQVFCSSVNGDEVERGDHKHVHGQSQAEQYIEIHFTSKLQSTSAENQLVGKTTSLTNVFSK